MLRKYAIITHFILQSEQIRDRYLQFVLCVCRDAVCCSVFQRVTVECCSVFQCVEVCCSVLQCVAVCCSMLQCVEVGNIRQAIFSVCRCANGVYIGLQCSVLRRRVLQGVAGCCRVLQGAAGCSRVLQGVAGCCRVLQGAAGCCRVLQGVTF